MATADDPGMTCANCGASMRLDRGLMVCGYCRTEAVPAVSEDGVRIVGETKYPCPTCSGPTLFDSLMEDMSLHYCQTCRGMLVSMDSFLPLVEHLRAMRDRPAQVLARRTNADADRGLLCPLCTQKMDAHPYGGPGNIHTDNCEPCGRMWLDASELRRVVVAADPVKIYSRYDPDREFSPRQD